MAYPYCLSQDVNKRGFDRLHDGTLVQRYQCKDCHRRFNARTGTLMTRFRTSRSVMSYAIKARTEGMGVRAAGRTFSQSNTTIVLWEKRLADPAQHWSPPAPAASDATVEGDEVYTRVVEPLPPVSPKAGPSTSLNVRAAIG